MDSPTKSALLRCFQTASESGVPQDQAKRLVESGYIPLPWQWLFHAASRAADTPGGPVDIGLGGARGPGKSHAVLSQAGLDDCQRVPGLKGLFLRQTGIAAKESFDDLVDKVLRGRVEYTKTGTILSFPNGSRIVLGGFQDQNDIDKYIGIEYDFIIVEELNQLTEEKYTKLRGSLRTSKPNWRPRMYTSFNPGGIGHAFVKNRYVIPARLKQETTTRFIPSTYKSNPYLNSEYIDYLESLTGDLGKAWREGEWELFAGQFFQEFRHRLHVIPPFLPPKGSLIVGGCDWGRVKPFSMHFSVVERVTFEEETFYRVKTFFEVYGINLNPDEWSNEIKRKLKGYGLSLNHIEWVRADSKIFDKLDDGSVSIRDQFVEADERWRLLRPANKERVQGWSVMHDWLSIAPDGLPYWQMSEACPNLIRTLPELIHDENKVEDVDTEGEDHACLDENAQVLTNKGIKSIKHVTTKDKVWTPLGWSQVLWSGVTGIRGLSTYRGMIATKNHPFLTQDGFLPLKDLKKTDRFWNVSTSMENPTGDIQIHQDFPIGSIFGVVQRRMESANLHYIKQSGFFIMGRFQNLRIFITKMVTLLITLLRILKHSIIPYIKNYIGKNSTIKGLKQAEKTCLRQFKLHVRGTLLKKGRIGIAGMQKKLYLEEKRLRKNAIYAEKGSLPYKSLPNIVVKTTKLLDIGTKKVYNLKTDTGMFTANGVVVSNCDDQRYQLKHLKWIGAKRGGIKENADRQKQPNKGFFLTQNDEGQELSVDLNRFGR